MNNKFSIKLLIAITHIMMLFMVIISLIIFVKMIIYSNKEIILFLIGFFVLAKCETFLEKRGIDIIPIEEEWD